MPDVGVAEYKALSPWAPEWAEVRVPGPEWVGPMAKAEQMVWVVLALGFQQKAASMF